MRSVGDKPGARFWSKTRGGKIYEPLGGWYHSTKFAVEGLSDSLRLELKQFGIKVVVIEPAAIRSDWDGIAIENLKKVSSKSYMPVALKLENMFKRTYTDKLSSPPETVANTILKSIKAKNPRTRYASGKGAGMILFTRKILSDKMFDRVMHMSMN